MKKFLFGLVGLVVVVVAALLVGPGLWDWNGYKPEILERIKAETGREMAIDGDLSLAVLPSPRLAVAGVRIANIKGATAPEFARFKSLNVRVRLMPLLSGRIEVESIELIDPVIELEKLADGRLNWEIGAAPGKDAKETPTSASDRASVTDHQSFALDRLVIKGGRLIYRDAALGTVERLDNLNVVASAASLAGSLVSRSWTSSTPIKSPRPRTSPISRCLSFISRRRSRAWAPTVAAFSTRPSSSMISMVVSAARAVTGFFSWV